MYTRTTVHPTQISQIAQLTKERHQFHTWFVRDHALYYKPCLSLSPTVHEVPQSDEDIVCLRVRLSPEGQPKLAPKYTVVMLAFGLGKFVDCAHEKVNFRGGKNRKC